MDDGSIPAEARIRPRPSDPREERVSSSEAILSSEQVVSKEKEKARGFRLCLRGDDGGAAGTVLTRSYILSCPKSRDLVTIIAKCCLQVRVRRRTTKALLIKDGNIDEDEGLLLRYRRAGSYNSTLEFPAVILEKDIENQSAVVK